MTSRTRKKRTRKKIVREFPIMPCVDGACVARGLTERVPQFDQAADYRRRAEEARTMARLISLTDTKTHLLEAARHLEVLAQIEEEKVRQVAPIETPKQKA
jgi:hypothetical protein